MLYLILTSSLTKHNIISIILLVTFSVSLLGQSNLVKHYKTEDGLSNRRVIDMAKDEQGYLWLCIESDISLFDGYSFTPFHQIFSKQNQRQSCRKILVQDDVLLVQSYDKELQLDAFGLKTGTHQSIDLRKTFDGLSNIKEQKAKEQWFVTGLSREGIEVYSFDFAKLLFKHRFTIPQKLLSSTRFVFHTSQEGNYFFLFDNYEWMELSPSGKMLHRNRLLLPKSIQTAPQQLYIDRQDRIWVGLEYSDRLFEMDKSSNSIKAVRDVVIDADEIIFCEDDQAGLFIISNKTKNSRYAYSVHPDGKITPNNEMLKINNNITNIIGSDFSKFFWISSFEGLFRIKLKSPFIRSIYKIENPKSLLGGNIVRGIDLNSVDKKIYFTLERHSLPQKFDPYASEPDIQQINFINSSSYLCNYNLQIDQNTLWRIGCDDRRVGRIESYNLESNAYQVRTYPLRFYAFSITADKIYISGTNKKNQGALVVYDKNKKNIKPLIVQGYNPLKDKELTPNYILADKNKIWVCTNQGLYSYDLKTQKYHALDDNPKLNNLHIINLLIRGDNFYICTRNKGLVIYNNRSRHVASYDESNGLSNSSVAAVHIDQKNNIWIATFNGLNVVKPNGTIGQFFEKDGLPNNEFNRYAVTALDSTKLYFGTLNGIASIDLKKYNKSTSGPLRLNQVTEITSKNHRIVTNLRWQTDKKLTIQSQSKTLKFNFSNLDLAHSDDISYWVRIPGYQDEWTPLGNKNEFEMTKLKQGDYSIQIKTATSLGLEPTTFLSKDFSITTPFYKRTSSLLTLGILGLFGVFSLIFHYRVNQIKKREEERRKTNERFSELELQALRSQMNPHFIFNALGSIQYFIQTADTDAADAYLTKFAQLMRKYLDASKEKFITLQEETELITLYIDIERLRLDESFDYEINIDDDIAAASVLIPSMLIQPFVENAIVHGLSGLQNKRGLLKIEAHYQEDSSIIIIIDDNGVGRKHSTQTKMAMGKRHKSRGLHIARDRINTLNRMGKTNIQLEIIDKESNTKEPLGTTVVIKIKHKNHDPLQSHTYR